MSYYDRRDSTPLDCKVYVGNLGSGASRNELEKEFAYFGPLTNVWVARNPPGFAYIEFEDSRDAKDAVRNLDGEMLCGRPAKVELSHGKQRNKSFRSSYGERPQRRPNMSDIRCYSCNDYGHYSRDCQRDRRSRSRSRSPRRRHKSRSESRDRSHSKSHSKSRSRSRSSENGNRSRSPEKRERSRSRSRSSKRKSRSKSSEVNRSYSHSRSRSSSR